MATTSITHHLGDGLSKSFGDWKYASNFSKVAYCWQTSNFADRRQSEARNFETAQYIVKQKLQLSSTINALQNATKLESLTYGVLTLRVGEKWQTISVQKCVFCPIARHFLLVGRILPAYNFSATMALPLALIVWGGCGLPKVFCDSKYTCNFGKVAYCWQESNLDFTARSLSDTTGNINEMKQLRELYFLLLAMYF